MNITEWLGLGGTLLGTGGTVAFGWMAYRARGEAMRAQARQGAAEGLARAAGQIADECNAKRLDAERSKAAAHAELSVAHSELERKDQQIRIERMEKARLYANLAKLGAPVGDTLVDSALDRLFPADRDKDGDR